MKLYSAIIVTNNDKIDILYECDNNKNLNCKGHNSCRECEYTTELRYAKDISKDKTRLELKKELVKKDKEIEDYKQIIRYLREGQDIFKYLTLNQIRKIYDLEPIEQKINIEKRVGAHKKVSKARRENGASLSFAQKSPQIKF